MHSIIPQEVIDLIHRELPDVDLFLDHERQVHVIVSRLRAPVKTDERLRNVIPEAREGAVAIPYQFLGYCELTHDDGSTTPFIPDMTNARNIIQAIKVCSINVDNETGWREFENNNKEFDERAEQEFLRYVEDVAKENFTMDRDHGRGRRYSTQGVPMTGAIRS